MTLHWPLKTKRRLHLLPRQRFNRAQPACCWPQGCRRRVNVHRSATSSGVPLGTLIVLMLAVFTVSVGFGVVLPLLPGLIASLSKTAGSDRSIASNTGLLTSTCALALFFFAPLWGRAAVGNDAR